MKISNHELATLPKQASADELTPYTQALREYFPSREALLQEAKRQTRRQKLLKKTTAAVAIPLAFALSWMLDPVLHSESLRTEIGQQASVDIKDGSHVALNTNSVLVIEQHLYSRRLHLQRGEALFTAQHGWRPFTVYANQTEIRDIGTVFNVRNTLDGAVVTVVEGSVEVSTAQAKRVLTNDVSVSTQAGVISESRCTSANIAWQQGRLMFDGTSLTDVISELQRYHRGHIEIADAKVAQYRLSGEYDIKGIDALIDTLPEIMPVRVTRRDDNSIAIMHR